MWSGHVTVRYPSGTSRAWKELPIDILRISRSIFSSGSDDNKIFPIKTDRMINSGRKRFILIL